MPALKSLTSRWQFSLGTLLAMMGWIAVMCIALKTPTQVWTAILFLMAFVGIMASLVGIMILRGRRRAFAIGYFAFSFGYLTCLFATEKQLINGVAAGQMPTSLAAASAFQQWHKDSVQTMTVPMGGGIGGYGGGVMGGGMGGGFGGGGSNNGGGGFFSVDSSETAVDVDADAAAAADGREGPAPVDSAGAAGPGNPMPGNPMPVNGAEGLGSGGMAGGGMPGGPTPGTDSGMGDPFGGDMSGMSAMPGMPGGMGAPPMTTYTVAIYSQDNFVMIVHCLLTMLLGIAGGLSGQYFSLSSRETPPDRPAPSTTGN